ncbi:MAG: amino acid decarboxylase [Gemmatimonadetes bacterium]|nr:amino acid decarboxylase [Gemmatimonadota bacterium]
MSDSPVGPSPPIEGVGDMDAEAFRVQAHQVVDWIADYLASVGDRAVFPDIEPGWLRSRLPAHPPAEPESMDAVLTDFRELVVPAITHWNHPSFHAYFANSASGPGILGEMLAAALNANAMVWRASPAGTELEEVAVDWLREIVGLPPVFAGVINDTASTSTLVALAAAREAGALGDRPGRIYASVEAHSSVQKAGMVLGLGRDGVQAIPTDAEWRMQPQALADHVRADREAGVLPLAVVATLGTTSTTSVDPVAEIAEIAAAEQMWLHVDAAYAGPAAVLPELARHFVGWERADSIVVNPHKWLFTPMDCSVLFFRDPDRIRAAFSLTPEYLKTPEEGQGTNLMDYGVALGRRFRALKLWMVIRAFGVSGIEARIREHCRLARLFASWVADAPGWEVSAPVPFASVLFRWTGRGEDAASIDAANHAVLEGLNRSGTAFLSHTVLEGRTVLKLSVGNLRTTEADLARTWTALRDHAARP